MSIRTCEKISATDIDEFKIQLDHLLAGTAANQYESIIYQWQTEKPIPRVIGASRTIYIGRTVGTFRSRYGNKRAKEIEYQYFKNVYQHIIGKYGSITISLTTHKDIKMAERAAIDTYYVAHRELPPINLTRPKG